MRNKGQLILQNKLGIIFLIALIVIVISVIPQAQNVRVFKENNHFGYKDQAGEVKLKPMYSKATPLIYNFTSIDIESFDLEELLMNHDGEKYFLHPIGLIFQNDSLGVINHKGEILAEPIKCRLVTRYQDEEMKFIENLEPESEDFGKFAFVFQSGLHVSPFVFCDEEDWDGWNSQTHMRFEGKNKIKDVIFIDCEGRKIFLNQIDGLTQVFSDTVGYILLNDGYFIAHNASRLSLYRNNQFIRSISVDANTNRIGYENFGILSLVNEEGITLMDTTGIIIYHHPKGEFFGINGHGHAKFCDEELCTYVDVTGKIIKKCGNTEFFSTEVGYTEYNDSEAIEYDKDFKEVNRWPLHEEIFEPARVTDYGIYNLLCQNDDFISALKEKNIGYPLMIMRHNLEKGKYTFIEIKTESGNYFFKECSVEPFFEINTNSFEYKGNDIFYLGNDDYVSIYHAAKGWVKNFGYDYPEEFMFQNKPYYSETYVDDNSARKTKIYDSEFNKLNREFNNFEISGNQVRWFPTLSFDKKSLYFQFDNKKQVIPFDKIPPELAFRNANFLTFKEFSSSSSIYLRIRDTFHLYLIEINFPDIIEAPENFTFQEFKIEFEKEHHIDLLSNYLKGSQGYNVESTDSLICFDLIKGDPPCLNIINKKVIKVSDKILFPETSLVYFNRQLSTKDCFDVGYTDRNGNVVIPHHYTINGKTSFKYGTAIVTKIIENKVHYGLIDTSENFLIPLSPCRMYFAFSGNYVIKNCYIEGQPNLHYLYDTYGNQLEETEYLSEYQDFIIVSVSGGRYHIYIFGNKNYFDVDDINNIAFTDNLEDLRVEIAGNEYKFENNDHSKIEIGPVPHNTEKQVLLKSGNILCNHNHSVTFLDVNNREISFLPGEINSIDYNNEYVWLTNPFGKKTLVDFSGNVIFKSNHTNFEYFSNCHCFMGTNNNGDFSFYYVDK